MSRKSDLANDLAGVPLFAACSKSDIKILCRHMVEVVVDAGEVLVTEGEMGDAFYVVIDGEADVLTKRKRIATLGHGSSFGELAILDPAPRNATVIAATPMTLGVLGARVFRAVLRDVPSLTDKLLAGMARRLREADKVANDITARGAGSSRDPRAFATSKPKASRRT